MSDIRIPRGNTFYTRVTVVAVDAATRTPISGFSLNDCTDLHVYYIRRNKQTEITNYTILDGNRLRIKWLGTDMKIGGYGLEATGIYNALEWRFYNTDRYVFSIVESNEEANIPPSAFIETDYYAINAEVSIISSLGGAQADWSQTDPSEPDYIKNKPDIPTALSDLTDDSTHRLVTDAEKSAWDSKGTYSKPSGGIPPSDLSSEVQASLSSADTALQEEVDPVFSASAAASITDLDVTNWNGKTSNIGTITSVKMNGSTISTSGEADLGTVVTDVSGKANKSEMAISTSGDQTTITIASGMSATVINSHQSLSGKQDTLVSGTNIKTINNESILGSGNITIQGGSGGEENVIEVVKVNNVALTPDANKAVNVSVPTKVSDLTNDSGYITTYTETDPTVPSWAKASSKPSYTASEVGAVPTTRTVNGKALSADITLSASDVNALPSSTVIPDAQIQSDWDQTTTTAKDYIKNKPTIPSVVDSLSSASTTAALSANQGLFLKPTAMASRNVVSVTGSASVVGKVASAPWSGFELINNLFIRIRFTNRNTAASPTLKIGDTDAKPIYYNGQPASSSNSWAAGDLVEGYYDGTNWMLHSVDTTNRFSTGELLKDIGIDDFPKTASGNIVKSAWLNGYFAQVNPIGNLYNPNDVEVGKDITSDGSIVGDNRFNLTGYISCKPQTNYSMTSDGNYNLFSANNAVGYYNSSHEMIGYEVGGKKTFTTPSNCYYMRVTVPVSATKVVVKEGTERGEYEEYNPISGYIQSLIPLTKEKYDLITEYETKPYTLASDLTKYGSSTSYSHGYIPVSEGEKYRIVGKKTNTRYAFCTSPDGGAGDPVLVVSGTSVVQLGNSSTDVVIPSGCNYLVWTATSSNLAYECDIYKIMTLMDEVDVLSENVEVLNKEIGFSNTLVGLPAKKINADDLSTPLELADFPYANKFGDKYTFGCRVSSFQGIKICRGYESYRARWFEIDATNITLKGYESATSVIDTVAHGLTISSMLNVNINVTAEGKAVLNIQSLGGLYTHTFEDWGYDANGVLSVRNDGSSLSDCCLTAVNSYLNAPLWVFGASYEGMSNARWVGQLKNMGYMNYLVNGFAGRNGAATIEDINRALNYGTPKYLYYAGSNDSTDTIYENNLDELIEICESKGITLITYLRPDNPSKNFAARRAYVLASGIRYVNGELALHDPSKTWAEGVDTWYTGFLSSDGMHPTELGAEALAMQFLIDFPELAQYSRTGEDNIIPL